MRSELTRMLRQQPFVPFTILANDGRSFEIKHVDFCMITPNAAYVYVGDEKRDSEEYEVVRLAFSAITSLDSRERVA